MEAPYPLFHWDQSLDCIEPKLPIPTVFGTTFLTSLGAFQFNEQRHGLILFFSQSSKENRGGEQENPRNRLYFRSLFARANASAMPCPKPLGPAKEPLS